MIHLFQLGLQNWLNMRIQSGARTIKERTQHYAEASGIDHKKVTNKLKAHMQSTAT